MIKESEDNFVNLLASTSDVGQEGINCTDNESEIRSHMEIPDININDIHEDYHNISHVPYPERRKRTSDKVAFNAESPDVTDREYILKNKQGGCGSSINQFLEISEDQIFRLRLQMRDMTFSKRTLCIISMYHNVVSVEVLNTKA